MASLPRTDGRAEAALRGSSRLYGRRAEKERLCDVGAWDAVAPRSLSVPRWRRLPCCGEVAGGETGWARAEGRKCITRKHRP